jgi:hypothetical protein
MWDVEGQALCTTREAKMDVTILTEDWFNGYTPPDERLVPDVEDVELDPEEQDDYPQITEDEHQQAHAELLWLHRDEDDNRILARWNRPDDELDEIDQIEQQDERAIWVERMTAFHEKQLHRRLVEYFGTADYMQRELVLRWEQKNSRWVPAEKIVVREWIARKIEEKGSRLSGIASCNGTIRAKVARRKIANDKTGQSGSFVRAFNEA